MLPPAASMKTPSTACLLLIWNKVYCDPRTANTVRKDGMRMTISDCCGAATKVVYRSDHPFVYDDPYELLVPVLVCTKCGKAVELNSNKAPEDPSH